MSFRVLQRMRNGLFNAILTITVIAISLTILIVFYVLYKNFHHITMQCHPAPYIIAYLQKTLENSDEKIISKIKADRNVKEVYYISNEDELFEFYNSIGFGDTIDMIEENPIQTVAIIVPKINFQNIKSINILRERITNIQGVDEVYIDDSWFSHLVKFTNLLGYVSEIISAIIIATVFLIISNSTHLKLFSRYEIFHIQKIMSEPGNYLVRSLLCNGVLIGFFGVFLSLILSKILILWLASLVKEATEIFRMKIDVNGLSFYESFFLLLTIPIIGWIASWFVSIQSSHFLIKNKKKFSTKSKYFN